MDYFYSLYLIRKSRAFSVVGSTGGRIEVPVLHLSLKGAISIGVCKEGKELGVNVNEGYYTLNKSYVKIT